MNRCNNLGISLRNVAIPLPSLLDCECPKVNEYFYLLEDRFMMTTFLPVELVLIVGWVLASTLGTWAYFANDPKK